MRKYCLVLASCLLLAGCGNHEKLPAQAPADLIKITTAAGFPKLPRREIREKDRIAALVAFVNSLPNKWSVPWYGAPIGRVYFEFISANNMVGNFYVGPNFVGRDSGKSYSQGTDRETIEELGKIVDMDLWEYVSASGPAPAPAPVPATAPSPAAAPVTPPAHHP